MQLKTPLLFAGLAFAGLASASPAQNGFPFTFGGLNDYDPSSTVMVMGGQDNPSTTAVDSNMVYVGGRTLGVDINFSANFTNANTVLSETVVNLDHMFRSEDGFISAYDNTGELKWTLLIQGQGGNQLSASTVGADGSLFIAGQYEGAATISLMGIDGTISELAYLSNDNGDSETFYGKLSAQGDLAWVKTAGSNPYPTFNGEQRMAVPNGIAVDDNGMVIVGTYSNEFSIDGSFFPSAEGDFDMPTMDGFVLSADLQGNPQWASVIRGPGFTDMVDSVALGTDGTVYIASSLDSDTDIEYRHTDIASSFSFDATSNDGDTDVGTPRGDAFCMIQALGSNGNILWSKALLGANKTQSSDCSVAEVAFDAQNNRVVVAGGFEGALDFNPAKGIKAAEASQGDADLFVVSLNAADGAYHWHMTLGEAASETQQEAEGITVYQGNLILGADLEGNGFVGTGTAALWASEVPASAGSQDAAIIKLDAAGQLVWAKTVGGAGEESLKSFAVTPEGNTVLSGRYKDTMAFNADGIDFSATTLDMQLEGDASASDAWVALLDSDGLLSRGIVANEAPSVSEIEQTIATNSGAVEIDVLAYASDPEGDTLSLASAEAEQGTVAIVDGKVSYTPATDFSGIDTITFIIEDAAGNQLSGTVTVTVEMANEPPVIEGDSGTVTEGESQVTFDILANDTDPEGDALHIESASAEFGSVAIVDNKLVYTPAIDFAGTDTVTYVVGDAAGNQQVGTLVITVEANTTEPGEPTPGDNNSYTTRGGSLGLWSVGLLAALGGLRRARMAAPVLAVAVATPAAADSQDQESERNNWYLNTNVGFAQTHVSSNDLNALYKEAGLDAAATKTDDDDMSASIYVGYQVNDWLALEAGYWSLGERSVSFNGQFNDEAAFTELASRVHHQSGAGPHINLVGTLPLSDNWQLAGKVGLFFWEGDYDTVDEAGKIESDSVSDTDLSVGLDLAYWLTTSTEVHLSYNYVQLKGDENTEAAVGLRYHF